MSTHNLETSLNTTELIEDIYPLSPIQQGLLFHALFSPELDVYFQHMIFSIESAIDVDVLAGVWQRMAQRHSVFRTAFFWEGLDLPMQIVHSQVNLPLDVTDLRMPADEQQARIDQYLADDQKRGFNLSEVPLWRVALLRTADRQYKLILSFHHLLVDGWSTMLLLKEAKALYEASCRGVDLQLPAPRPYRDYIGWLDQQDLSKAKAWWHERLQGFSEVTALPFASAVRRPVQSSEHRFKNVRLSRAETTALENLIRQHQLTMNTVLLGAWGLLLGRHSGQSDVVFGTTVSGRNPELAGVENMVGLFINTLPVRMQWDSEESAVDWLKRVQLEQAESYGLEHTPLVEIQGWSEIEQGSPLFETLLAFQNYSTEAFEERYGVKGDGSQGDGKLKIVGVEFLDRVNYPLALIIAPGAELGLRLEYHASRFSEANVERVLQHLRQILQSIGESGDAAKQKVREVKWMSADERAHVVEEWNRTEEEIPARCTHELFQEQAAKTPEAIAVEYEGKQLTYTALNQRANQLARYLQNRGVGPEALVGIYLDRTENLIVGFLAVLKAGGAYVPLDPNYPPDRLNFMIEETGLQAILTTSDLAHSLPDSQISMIKLDQDWEIISQETSSDLPVNTTLSSLAYVIYTSGSTGTPKGVQIEHRGMLNHLTAKIYDLQLTARDVVAETAPSSFDISVWQMLGALLTGGRVHIVDGNIAQDAFQLLNEIQRTGVTILETVPVLLQMMVEGDRDVSPGLPKLRWMISNAEALPISLCEIWKRKYPGIPLLNTYGSTECSDDISHYVVSGLEEGLPYAPLGRPLMNSTMYVVDEEMEPVPIGVPGELYIGGAGVGRGYWKRGGLTAQCFVPNPFSTATGERLYRTRDVVRQRRDGTLDFMGRRDHQVKIRGFRVELGEIESALLVDPSVKQAVVVVREDQPGEKRLVAYLVLQSGSETVNTALLQASLQDQLPEYMVPSAFVVLQELPLNANGKVDRKRLPQPQAVEAGTKDRNARTVEEEILCGIWEQVLKVERVGVEANFFELGGHSLLATQVVSRIREAFGVEIPLRTLFERPTVAGLAEAVTQARGQEGGRTVKPLQRVKNRLDLPLSFAQERLWFLEQMEPGNAVYNVPLALRIRGELDREALSRSIGRIVERHEVLRTVFVWNREQEPVQRVLSVEEAGVAVEVMELGELGAEQREAEARRLAGVEAGEGFNLSTGPLLRVKLLRLGETEHVLLVTMHHIVSDGWSVGVLVREFMELYRGEREQREVTLEELPIQYGDYAVWQREWLQGEVLKEQLEYWRAQLAGAPVLEFPTDKPRPAVASHRGQSVTFELSQYLRDKLLALARRESVTPFMLLLAAYQALLFRYTEQEDIVVGTPIANRNRAEIESLIGFFINHIALRSKIRRHGSFSELLAAVRAVSLGVYAHQDLPFEKLVEELSPERTLSHAPLFQVVFALQNVPYEEIHLSGLKLASFPLEREFEKADLSLVMEEREDVLKGELGYATDLFENSTIERFIGHFRRILEDVAQDPSKPIENLILLTEAEREQLLETWNPPLVVQPAQTQRLHELFEAQVTRIPEATAVVYEDQALTYAELNQKANQLARYLRSLGVERELRVGIFLERSLDTIVAVLGILKAGAAYVPLDSGLPTERLSQIIEDAQAAVLITREKLRGKLPSVWSQVISIDQDWETITQEETNNLAVSVSSDCLAYVIFTSGSTGKPKAVGIEHRQICSYTNAVANLLQMQEGWSYALISTFAADLGNTMLFPSLCVGGTLHIIAEDRSRDGKAMAQYVEEHGALDCLKITPTQLRVLLESGGSSIVPAKRLVVGGEATTWEWAQEWQSIHPECGIWNHYGPTESTVGVCAFDISGAMSKTSSLRGDVLLGKPLPHSRLYVLDEAGEPAPVGVPGELYIGGEGVGRGYLNSSSAAAEKFVPDPFAGVGSRLYRTGDRVRWTADGNLEFLGRKDKQVKVRGYRVELGEIESVLNQHPGVRQGAVVLREDEPGQKQLVAYVIPRWQDDHSTQDASRYRLRNGLRVAQQNKNETEYLYREIFENQVYFQHGIELPQDACVFDIGANIGMFTLFIGKCRPKGRIYAFEPIFSIFECLKENTGLIGAHQTKIFPIGLSNEEKTADFTYYPRYSMMSGLSCYSDADLELETVRQTLRNQKEAGDESAVELLASIEDLLAGRFEANHETCQLRRLSDVIREERLERIDLLKVDAQRAELDVLLGLDDQDWPKIQQVVMEVHDGLGLKTEGQLQKVLGLLESKGFYASAEQYGELRGTDRWNLYASRKNEKDRNPQLAPALATTAANNSEPAAVTGKELKAYLAEKLPEYMVPAAFVMLDELPLLANGKLNYKALPRPQERESLENYKKPRTPIEEILAGIWSDVLKVDHVGIEDNFFVLGGHSLLATQVISRAQAALGAELSLRMLFEEPTIAGFAGCVEWAKKQLSLPISPITPASRELPLRLSFGQQRLWFLQQLDPDSNLYNLPYALCLTGLLDQSSLHSAFSEIVRRHEVLRTRYEIVDGEAVQCIDPASAVPIEHIDLRRAVEPEAEARALAQKFAREAFDLSRGPLMRVRLLQLADHDYVLCLVLHHIASDGWSLGILVREFMELYRAEREQREAKLEELSIQYGDYAVWQREWLGGGEMREQMGYWKEQLAGLETLELRTDHPRPAVMSHQGETVSMELEEELTGQIRGLCRAEGVTLFMALLGAVQMLLGRYAGQQDIAVGAPIANRTRREIEPLIGFFVNTLVLRGEVQNEWTLREMLKRVREVTLAAYAHQDVPFEHLVEELQPARDLSRNPLFDVMLIVENTPQESFSLPELTVETLGTEGREMAKFDLTFSVAESGGRIKVGINYAMELYERETIERMGEHFRAVVREMSRNAESRIGEITILGDAERAQLEEWNRTEQECPQRCVHELFEDQVMRAPEAAAVEYEGEQLSYRELNRRSNQLAHYLRNLGVGPEVRVGVCVERSLEMVVGLLAILKAGGAYVPLDPEYPPEHLRCMLEDSAPVVLLTQGRSHDVLGSIDEKVAIVDINDAGRFRQQPESNLEWVGAGLQAGHLAYVIYTSGSTGRPKGVMVSHRNLLSSSYARKVAYGESGRFLLLSSFSFDSSVAGIFGSLICGGTLIIATRDVVRDPLCLSQEVERLGVQSLLCVPSLYKHFLEYPIGGEHKKLSLVIVAGEACPPDLVAKSAEKVPQVELCNEYGPTEGTVWATVHRCAHLVDRESVPIGNPITNTRVHILDAEGGPVPIGVVGELYIGGAGVARGYMNRPDLSAERFLPDPFGEAEGARMYRTGDLGFWRKDGRIEFLGRNDFQVKVRGYRIELREIEAALLKQPEVSQAVVVVQEIGGGEKRLVAYYTCRQQQAAGMQAENQVGAEVETEANTAPAVGAEELRRRLAVILPDYMVPAAYVRLQHLPLTANGKLDRKALPQPEGDAYAVRGYQAPIGEIEQKLASIWAEVLKVERVGRQDNFFALGGHSLLAITLIEHMKRNGLGVDVRTLFAEPTLADLAAAILKQPAEAVVVPPNRIPTPCQAITPEMMPLVELKAEEIEQIVRQVEGGAANVQDIYPLAPLQEGIFFHHLMGEGESDPYVAGTLLRFDRRERLERYVEAMQKVVDRHDILRTAVLWEALSQPVQVVQRKARLEVEELELEDAKGVEGVEKDGREEVRRDAGQQMYERYHPRSYRMDMRRAPLLRLHVAQDRQDGRWLMMVLLHHLAGDHSTLEVMREEVRAHLDGREHELPVPLPFRNLVAQARLGVSQEEHESFFRQMLSKVDEPTAPFGLLDVRGDGRGIEELGFKVERSLTQRMRGAARRLGVSVASVCHVAWGRVLAQLTGREEVVFGTVLFGRMQGGEGADRVLGLFMNTLPVLMEVGGRGVEASVMETQGQLAELMRHEHAPLALAQRCSGVQAPLPLFTALLNYRHSRNVEQAQIHAKGTSEAWEGVEWERGEARTNYPLILSVDDLGEGFQLTAQTVEWVGAERVCRYMERALESTVEALEKEPEKAVRSVAVLSEEERQQVVYVWNQTEQEYPQRCVHELFEKQASRTPNAIALEYEAQMLTYGELNRRANQLGHYLRKLGVGPEVRVGICVKRSLEMVIGLLGILKAGGGYVPLDPDYPPERLQFMAEDAQVAVLLTQKKFQDLLWTSGVLEICVEDQWGEIAQESEAEVGVHLSPRHLAYVIFTSGSTGRPKGVGVEHRSIVRLVKGTNYVEVKEQDVFLQMAPVSFDAATFEIWGSLLNGCRLVVSPAGMLSLEELGAVVEKSGVTVLWLTAGLFHQMVDAEVKRLQGVRQLLAGGDALSKTHVVRALAELGETCLINGYGPTENTTFSCCHRMRGEAGSELREIVPIGRPITNSQAYVLDEEMRYEPMPVGVGGELYVGGEGLARGYMNRPELTAEKFVPNPFSERGGERLYRTGDRVRWRGDGNLEFAGRLDNQVKLRGYRIELGEIEAVLRGMAGVKNAAVVMREEAEGDQRLVAYMVMEEGEDIEERGGKGGRVRRGREQELEWRGYVAAKLPEYMVPSHFVVLEELPLTANGKLDRKALPTPMVDVAGTGEERELAPVEQIVAAMYEEVLGVKKVGAEGDFFDLGGHSLLATQVISRVRKVFEVEMGLRVLFEEPTVAGLARRIEEELRKRETGRKEGSGVQAPAIERRKTGGKIRLSFAQQRLWFIEQMEPGSAAYNMTEALRVKGELRVEVLERAFGELERRHESLRTRFEEEGGEAWQVVEKGRGVKIQVEDLRGVEGEKAREAEARRRVQEEGRRGFDLRGGGLLRVKLLRLGELDHVLIVSMHHIVSDGWSLGVMVREFGALYAAYAEGKESPLREMELQYGDYAEWQRDWLKGEVLEEQLGYWRKQLASLPVLELETDYERPPVKHHEGAVVRFALGEQLSQELERLSRREGVTLFMVVLAGWQMLLSRYSGQRDVAVGVSIANRNREESEGMIGFFVNTLVLRSQLEGGKELRDLLGQVRQTTLEAYRYQDVPFERVVEELRPERSLERTPLFQAMLVFQNLPSTNMKLEGSEIEGMELDHPALRSDLDLYVTLEGAGVEGRLAYDRQLFKAETIERMVKELEQLLQRMTTEGEAEIEEVVMGEAPKGGLWQKR
jgi:amino acid adenylation domain-containing protein/FkbM family methyltransferase